MAYKWIGSYRGERPFSEVIESLSVFDLRHLPANGFTTITDRVQETFQPLLGHIFPSPWRLAMLIVVVPHGKIATHKDEPTHFVKATQRYHLVLQTNDHAWSYHDGTWQHLELGNIYTIDPSLEHAAFNRSAEPRVHLMVDCDAISGDINA